jgi:flagellar biogenesis protein FliO
MSPLLLLIVAAQAQEVDFPTSDVAEENGIETLAAAPSDAAPDLLLTWEDMAPTRSDAPAIRQTTNPVLPPWLLATLGLGLLGAAWALRRRLLSSLTGESSAIPMTVVSRQSLGHHSSLLVVDVMDLDGSPRRLVVGTGQGTPSLVADISAPTLIFDDAPMHESGVESIPDAPIATAPAPLVAPATELDILPDQRQAAQDLVDELLAQREGYGRSLRGTRINVTA